MNRLDFLHQLYLSLEGIPEVDRRNLLRDFEAHFQLAQQEGRSEEETAAALGDPARVADQLKTQYRAGGSPSATKAPPPVWPTADRAPASRPRRRPLGFLFLGAGLLLLVASFLFAPALNSAQTGVERSLSGWLAEAAPGETYQVNETETISADTFQRIEIHTISQDLSVSLVQDGEVTSTLQGTVTTTSPKSVPTLVQETDGDTLVIRVVRTNSAIGYHVSNVKLQVSLPDAWEGDLQIVGSSSSVTLPEGRFSSLDLRTVSGDLDLGILTTRNQFALETSSGEIRIDSAICKRFEATTVSGDLQLDSLRFAESADISTSSGSLDLLNSAGQSLRTVSISGDILLQDAALDSLSVEGASSVVKLANITGNVQVKTISGDVTMEKAAPETYTRIETSSGEVRAEFAQDSGLKVDVSSSSGSMNGSLALAGETRKDHAWSGTRGDGSIEVTIKTISGEVTLD